MKRVLILSPGEDTGGVGIALKQAFDRWAPDWRARSVRRLNNYIDYPADIEWSGEFPSRQVSQLYRFADVVHVMERPNILKEFGPTTGKRIVVHHLGSYYRSDPEGVSAKCKAIGATEVTSGDLLELQPHLKPLNVPSMDLDMLAAYRTAHRPSRRIRIAHAPTNRAVKDTEAIIAAVDRLKQRHRIDLDIIEGQSWKWCLELKAQADIYVDETRLGYGVNALECFAMGIPVVSGIADPVARDRMIAQFGGLPFFETTEASIEASLETLIVDPGLRSEWGERGQSHVHRFHSPQVVVEQLRRIYTETERAWH